MAGCWAHARRKFADIDKAASDKKALTRGQKVADEAIRRIAAIYHTDHMYKGTSPTEILDNRQQSVKPRVDAYFAWIKGLVDDPAVPLDNNDAERSIKKFCVGKHS